MLSSKRTSETINYTTVSTILATFSCYCSSLGYGMCLSSFGAAIPEMSEAIDTSEGKFGELLLLRGIGYLVGTVLVSIGSKRIIIIISQQCQTALAISLSALATFVFQATTDFNVFRALSMCQGIGFGASDTLVVLVISKLWGKGAQPWLQGRGASISIGGIIGALLVGIYGYSTGFIFIALLCTSCFLFLGLEGLVVAYSSSFAAYANGIHIGENSGGDSCSNLKVVEMESFEDNTVRPYHPDYDGSNSITFASGGRGISFASANKDASEDTCGDADEAVNQVKVVKDATDKVNTDSESDFPILPKNVLLTLCLLQFFLVGWYFAVASWLSTYSQEIGATSSDSGSALLLSYYFIALLSSSLLSIPLSARYAPTTLVSGHMILGFLAMILFYVFFSQGTFWSILLPAILLGLSVSPLYTICLRLPVCYHYHVSDEATSIMISAAVMGEAIIPAIFGFVMDSSTGPRGFLYCTTLCVVVFYGSYQVSCVMMKKNMTTAVVIPTEEEEENQQVCHVL